MKTYYLDTNILLRFLLKDNPSLTGQAREHFQQAERGEIALVVPSFILMETNHVLRSVYEFSREEITSALIEIVQTPFLDVQERPLLIEALRIYQTSSVDLEDALLFVSAKHQNAEVLSFDKDFKKLA